MNGASSVNFSESHTGLRLFLLRPASQRTQIQHEYLAVLKKSYKNYMETNRPENDVATLLVHEWKFLHDMQPTSPPGPPQRRASVDLPERSDFYQEKNTNLSPNLRERASSISLDQMSS